ncbi:MAG: hypothetical protein QM655_01240 [Nocardioidaceae bacterium]
MRDDGVGITLPGGEPLPLRPSELPTLSESDRLHVLWGDAVGGCDLWGTREPDVTEFPERWDGGHVLAVIDRALSDPTYARYDEFKQHLHLYRLEDEVVTLAVLHHDSGAYFEALLDLVLSAARQGVPVPADLRADILAAVEGLPERAAGDVARIREALAATHASV